MGGARRCAKCQDDDLGFEPKGDGPAVCVRCSTPPRNLELLATCIAGGCYRDALCTHWDGNPRMFARYCHSHAWKSLSAYVPMDSIRGQVVALHRERMRSVNALPSDYDQQDASVADLPTDLTNRIGIIGEVATFRALGGELLGKGKSEDIRLRGRTYEIKTGFTGWPYDKWWPSAAVKREQRPSKDLILCVTDGREHVHVIAWLPIDKFLTHARQAKFGWWLGFTPHRDWRSIRELQEGPNNQATEDR